MMLIKLYNNHTLEDGPAYWLVSHQSFPSGIYIATNFKDERRLGFWRDEFEIVEDYR